MFLLLSLHVSAIDKAAFEKYFQLLPQPKSVVLGQGKGIGAHALRSLLLTGTDERPVLYDDLKQLPLAAKNGTGVLTLELVPNSNNNVEAYRLEVKAGNVRIHASGKAGLFYGCQTLRQLLRDADAAGIDVPACTITDAPDIAYRAVHIDLKHHLDVTLYYYDVIDRLAAIKVNAIILEFEDKLRYRKAKTVGAAHAISVEEFAAISRYAADRYIEISPLVQGLGHASFILKHPEYANLRDTIGSDWSFDPMNPQTYALQFSLYDDAIAATPNGKYLHIGGDEVGRLGMSALSKQSGMNSMQLQMMWLKKVCAYAREHNRIPIFWDDMVFKLSGLYRSTHDEKMPLEEVTRVWQQNTARLDENIALFPKECIYMRWNYDSPDIPGNHRAIDWYNAHQLQAMAATAAQAMWPAMPRKQSNYESIKDFCRITAEKKLKGILCTAWDDCSPHFETYWRGFYDFAFFSWNYIDMPAQSLHARFRHRFYAPAVADNAFAFQDLLEQSLTFRETAWVEKGRLGNYPSTIPLITLPGTSGEWRKTHQPRLDSAALTVQRYQLVKEQINKAFILTRDNHYALSVLNAINELQVYPARLMLLLAAFDSAPGDQKKQAGTAIRNYMDSFPAIRNGLEAVYSRTRILGNPEGYIQDQNYHHHLANGTVNNDWMFVYELAINKKLTEWLDR